MTTADTALRADTDPAELGFDAERLERIDRHFDRYVDDGRLAGYLAVVARDGRIAHVASAGKRDLESGAPVELDTLWRIYSMTKPITTVAAMILWEEGAFELRDPVERYIPAFADARVYLRGSAQKPLTAPLAEPGRIWHLMTHTSGLTYGFHHTHAVDEIYRANGFEWSTPPGMDLAACCEAWAGMPLAFEPGAEWLYSVATDVLGRVVEVVSGQSLDAFLAERVFGPLGMSETAFCAAPEHHDRLAALYAPGPPTRPAGRLAPICPPRPPRRSRGADRPAPRPRRGGPLRPDRPARAEPARRAVGRQRPRLDGGRLPPLRADAPRRRRARRRAPPRPADRALHGQQPPPGRRRPRGLRPPAVRRNDVRGRRLRARVRRRHGSGRGPVAGVAGRVRLGRRGEHGVLGRPGRAPDGPVLHAAAALEHLSDPLAAAPARPPGAR